MPAIKNAAFYVNKKKAVTFNSAEYTLTGGREGKAQGDGKTIYTKGNQRWKIVAKGPVPVAGSDGTSQLLDAWNRQLDVNIGGLIGTTLISGDCAILEGGYSGDAESGNLEETWTFEGSKPALL